MKNERGFSTTALVGLIATGAFVVFGFFYFVGYIGFRNEANAFEADIPAQYTNMQNVYDNGWKKVVETAQIPKMQEEQTKELYTAALTGRYGADGSKALVQFIQEQNPNLGTETYVEIQRTVQGFHDSFQASQTDLIARKQEYTKYLTATTASLFYNGIGGFPHIHCGIPSGTKDDYQIVTSDKTQNDFQQHKSAPLDLSKGINQ